MPTSSTKTYKPYPNFLDFVQSYNAVNDEGVVEFRNGKKPEDLIAFLMKIFTNEKDVVLDAFAGSGTTAAVSIKLNRQFICVEQMEYAETLTKTRLEGVINGQENDVLPDEDYVGGGSFIYCELAELNQKFVNQIQIAKDEDELVEIWKEIQETGFVNCYINPKDIDEEAEDFKSLTFEDKKRLFIELLDLNQLYVNYCDIDDETFGISEDDKLFTKSFYGDI